MQSLDGPTTQRVRIALVSSIIFAFVVPLLTDWVLHLYSWQCAGVRVLLDRRCRCPGVHEVQRGEFYHCLYHRIHAMSDLIFGQGRTKLLGRESAAGMRRRENRAARNAAEEEVSKSELPQ